MPVSPFVRACVVAVALLLPVHASAEAGRRPITAQDLWAVKRVGAPALSPDGRRAAISVQEWSIAKNKPVARIWLVDVAGGATRRLTNSDASDTAPAWSSDGTRLAFVSKRGTDEAASLYVIPADGGEAERVLDLPYGVASPRWLPGDTAIVFGTRVDPALAGKLDAAAIAAMRAEAKRRATSKMTAYATEVQQFRWFDRNLTDGLANRLVRVDLADGRLTDLTPGRDRLFTPAGDAVFQVSPDGRRIVLVVDDNPPPFVAAPNWDLVLLSTDGRGEPRRLTADNTRNDDLPRFSADGRSVYFVRQALPLPPYAGVSRRLWRHDVASGRNVPLSEAIDLSFDDIATAADGTVWLQAEKAGRVPLFRMAADGGGFTEVLSDGSITELDAAGGRLVFLREDADHPAELYTLDPARRRRGS